VTIFKFVPQERKGTNKIKITKVRGGDTQTYAQIDKDENTDSKVIS
jgi:hypothetical protein